MARSTGHLREQIRASLRCCCTADFRVRERCLGHDQNIAGGKSTQNGSRRDLDTSRSQLFQNHEELIANLSEILTELSQVLPQVDIDTSLFEVEDIQQAADKINFSIVELFSEMLKFYEEGRAKHVWHSFTKPFAIRFQSIRDSVRTNSMLLERLASAYGRKEGRVIHAKVNLLREYQEASEHRMINQLMDRFSAIERLLLSMSVPASCARYRC